MHVPLKSPFNVLKFIIYHCDAELTPNGPKQKYSIDIFMNFMCLRLPIPRPQPYFVPWGFGHTFQSYLPRSIPRSGQTLACENIRFSSLFAAGGREMNVFAG